MLFSSSAWATTHTVTNNGFNFVPDTLRITVGDTVVFNIGGTHNAVEVSETTFNNDGTMSNGGFDVDFGGGAVVLDEVKTYYYVCVPHVDLGMKAIIIAEEASQADEVFVAQLSGNHAALPVLSTGQGQVQAELTGSELVVTGSFDDLVGTFAVNIQGGAHLHRGFAGENGGIEIPLTATVDNDGLGGAFEAANNTFQLDDDQLEMLRERRLYVNIHTDFVPSGEIRGQLVPEADKLYYLNLFGSNEVPAVMSDGRGAMVLEVHDDTLVVTGTFMGLSGDFNANIGGGSHLHEGLYGQNGGVRIALNATVGEALRSGTYVADNNTFIIGDPERNLLERRAMYANIHTTRNPSGEIRGQVHEYATSVFRAYLAGSNIMPPVTSGGIGGLLFEVDGDDLTVSGAFSGIESGLNTDVGGGAHIHNGMAGRNGGVAVPLNATLESGNQSGVFEASDNNIQLTDDQLQQMLARGFYANLHSLDFPSGELRGQILPESQFYLNGFLSGTQQVDPVLTDGMGAVIAEVTGQRVVVTGSFDSLKSDFNPQIAGGAHLHLALAGTNGPIGIPLIASPGMGNRSGIFEAADNIFSVSTGQRDTLKSRMVYANIHTQDNPAGELRGQMLHEALVYFHASLSGASQPDPVRSEGRGAVAAEWTGSSIFASGSFSGLESDFNTQIGGGAHLHIGMAGMNGGVRFPLTSELGATMREAKFPVRDNVFNPGADFADTLLARMVYANIHSFDNPPGEIRGQLLPYSVSYFTTSDMGINEVPPVASGGLGGLKLELSGDRLIVSGAFSGLESDFNSNVGSHLHMAGPGANGGVAIPLNATIGDNQRSGMYNPADNTFTLTGDQRMALRSGMLYHNIHSMDVPSGEIRGQVLPETNAFPDSSSITAPASGAMLTIEGPGDTPFAPMWSPAGDPDGNTVVYVWQLATSTDFDMPVLSVNTGVDTLFETDFETVGQLLTSLGVQQGQTVTVYHRAIASDGSLTTTGAVDSVALTLGDVATGFDPLLAEQFQLDMFPVPATNRLNLNIDAAETAEAEVQLIDQSGRMVQRQTFSLHSGDNSNQLNVQQLPAGTYFVQLFINGQPLRARQVQVQR